VKGKESMNKLTLDTFITVGQDFEKNQYHVLHCLKAYYDEFSHNRLYPALSELIDLASALEGLLQETIHFQNRLPQQLKDVDVKNKRLVYESMKTESANIERIIDLIVWALPHMKRTIEEGKSIYDFVDDNITIEEVGIVPTYREAGYCFIPENKASLLHVLRYEVSLFTSEHERFRTLKARVLQSIHQMLVRQSLESIKLVLIKEHHDLPNPATYACETDLEFPFAETILPVAKRKLMARVFA
jgi:hypothetical protein